MWETITNFLSTNLFTIGTHGFSIQNLLLVGTMMVAAPILLWLIVNFPLKSFLERNEYKDGRKFAIYALVKYSFYVIYFLLCVQVLGIKLSVLWAAGAALLVGVGLGLQQTFNDFASGVILLIEGSVEKGDWIKVGSEEGKVTRIGLRTSQILTRRNISLIIPNSKITVDNVVNFTHDSSKVRHEVNVGVAYGSDVKKVKEILLQCAVRHSLVLKKPAPFVRFNAFGESSLDFQLLFWTEEFYTVEDIKSDLRFMIDNEFRASNIVIPFPQRVMHYASPAPDSKNLEENTVTKSNEQLPKT